MEICSVLSFSLSIENLDGKFSSSTFVFNFLQVIDDLISQTQQSLTSRTQFLLNVYAHAHTRDTCKKRETSADEHRLAIAYHYRPTIYRLNGDRRKCLPKAWLDKQCRNNFRDSVNNDTDFHQHFREKHFHS